MSLTQAERTCIVAVVRSLSADGIPVPNSSCWQFVLLTTKGEPAGLPRATFI